MDTTVPSAYAPLTVGNEWRYQRRVEWEGWGGQEFVRDRVVASVHVRGMEYAVIARESASFSVPAWHEVGRDTVRFDPESGAVVAWRAGEEVPQTCPLGAEFGATVTCEVGGNAWTATVRSLENEGFWGGGLVKAFQPADTLAAYPMYQAGVGWLGYTNEPEDHRDYDQPDFLDLYYAEIVQPDGEVRDYGYPEDDVPEVDADPTPPHLYYPLHVGFVHEMYESLGPTGHRLTRREVLRDTLVNGQSYAAEWSSSVWVDYSGPIAVGDTIDWGEGRIRWLRYDEISTRVVELAEDGTEVPILPPIGADFGTLVAVDPATSRVLPDGREGDFVVYGALGGSERIGNADVPLEAVKSFAPVPRSPIYDGPDPNWTYGARIGRMPKAYYFSCPCTERIAYLRTLDASGAVVEYGVPFATDRESGPIAEAVTLAAGPNPTPGPFTLFVDLPAVSTVHLEAFDTLGRRVWRRDLDLPAGRQQVEVDAEGWASGLYVIRAQAGGDPVTARVVKR